MLTAFLVRHASHGLLGRTLAGRMPGVDLDETGRIEAERVAGRLAQKRIGRLFTSPLERARQTAAAIAARTGLPPEIAPEVNELDCGAWTGASFDRLADDPRWREWNAKRATARIPGGEAMGEVQSRATAFLQELVRAGAERVAVVTHGDVIKAIVAGVLGLDLDRHGTFEIDPASVTTIELWTDGARVRCLNVLADP